MTIRRNIFLILLIALIAATSMPLSAQRNDKLLNRPYADLRRWHLGFSVGLHVQGIQFTHNGYTTPEGETWFMEQPSYSPGFCVNGLLDIRLNDYFSVRFTPGMYFGNRNVDMIDTTTGATESQNIKTNLIVLPLDLKFAAQRYRNARPYIVGGIMPAFDISKKRGEILQLNSSDFYLSVGFGCDFYLPFFKLNPEIKFCFGLSDVLSHDRPDLEDDPTKLKFTQSLTKATSKMVVLTFYFE